MCSCQQHATTAAQPAVSASEAVTVHVEDMTCGHCAGTIKGAIEAKLPGTTATADPVTRTVSVLGASDPAAIQAAIAAAGYTPSAGRIG